MMLLAPAVQREGSLLVGTRVTKDQQGKIVGLGGSAGELFDRREDRSLKLLKRGGVVLGYDLVESFHAELFFFEVHRLFDAVGREHQRVSGRKRMRSGFEFRVRKHAQREAVGLKDGRHFAFVHEQWRHVPGVDVVQPPAFLQNSKEQSCVPIHSRVVTDESIDVGKNLRGFLS